MKSRLGIVAVVLFLACVAGFVVYVSMHDAAPVSHPPAVVRPQPPAPKTPTPEPKPARKTEARDVEKPAAPPKDGGGTVTGRVTARAGTPVADAEITVQGNNAEKVKASTDANGFFTLTGLPPGNIDLDATHPDYLPGSAAATVTAGAPATADIVLNRPCAIQGTIRKDGVPVAGMKIHVMPAMQETTTDGQGRYRVGGLNPGDVSVHIDYADCGSGPDAPEWTKASTTASEGETATLDFDISPSGAAVEGVVLIEGQPPNAGDVEARIASPALGDWTCSTPLDVEGRYRLEGLPAGHVTLNASATPPTGTDRVKTIDFELSENETYKADFLFAKAGVVYGKVSGLSPEERGEVVAVAGDQDQLAAMSMQDMLNINRLMAGSTGVAADGTYRLDGLDPGPYTIMAIAISQGKDELLPHIRSAHQFVTVIGGSEAAADLAIN